MILAIDTSTNEAGLALMEEGELRAEWAWTTHGNHSRHLTRVLGDLMSIHEADFATLSGIVVAIGPGSFNGLRVGISAAKGLAFSLDVNLVGISTLDVIGLQASTSSRTVWALLPAGRGELYWCAYEGTGATWMRTSDYSRQSVARLADAYVPGILLAGAGVGPLSDEIERRGRVADAMHSPWSMRRPGYLAELGRRALALGATGSDAQLEPLYLRKSSAEENREARRSD
ncbi:MAG: tRNA (adenosine(37)-N6)-threonylcarbamoyltransferase complex dimerization subunit type 1 TsaB [Chloroflexota bacterium]